MLARLLASRLGLVLKPRPGRLHAGLAWLLRSLWVPLGSQTPLMPRLHCPSHVPLWWAGPAAPVSVSTSELLDMTGIALILSGAYLVCCLMSCV